MMTMTPEEILALPIRYPESGLTIRDYLTDLFVTLWKDGSGFDIKRPLGYSDWQWVVYEALGNAGIIAAEFDSDGYLDDADTVTGDKIVVKIIQTLMGSQRG